MKINPDETLIEGKWLVDDHNHVIGNENCARIHELTSNYLVRLMSDWSGWDTLYQDPTDNRFWEHTYLHGEMHGGGPPTLRNITQDEARQKYGI